MAYLQYAAAMQLSQLEKEFLTLSILVVISLCAIILGRRLASIAILIRGILATSKPSLSCSQVLRWCGLQYRCRRNRKVEAIEAYRRVSYGKSLNVNDRENVRTPE